MNCNIKRKDHSIEILRNIFSLQICAGAVRRNESPSKTGTDKKKSHKPQMRKENEREEMRK